MSKKLSRVFLPLSPFHFILISGVYWGNETSILPMAGKAGKRVCPHRCPHGRRDPYGIGDLCFYRKYSGREDQFQDTWRTEGPFGCGERGINWLTQNFNLAKHRGGLGGEQCGG